MNHKEDGCVPTGTAINAILELKEEVSHLTAECDTLKDQLNAMTKQLDKAIEAEIAFTKSRPCGGCPEGHDSFWKTVIESPQWKAWELITKDFDVDECRECGFLSQKHFQAFLGSIIESEKAAREKAEAALAAQKICPCHNDPLCVNAPENVWKERNALRKELEEARKAIDGKEEN